MLFSEIIQSKAKLSDSYIEWKQSFNLPNIPIFSLNSKQSELLKPVSSFCETHRLDLNFMVHSILDETQAYTENKSISPFDMVLADSLEMLGKKKIPDSMKCQPNSSQKNKKTEAHMNSLLANKNSFAPSEDELNVNNFFFPDTQPFQNLRSSQSLNQPSLSLFKPNNSFDEFFK